MKLLKPIIELIGNILAGTRAALFMPIRLWLFKGGFAQICFLLLVSFGLSLIYDYYDTAPDNYFNPYGLSYQALLYFAFFFSLSLIAALNSRLKDLGEITILLLSVVPVIWLGSICLLALAEQQTYLDGYQSNWAVFIIYSFWYLLVVARLIKRFFYLRFLPTIAYVLLYAALNFAPLFLLPTEPLWYPLKSNNKKVSSTHDINIESVYYSQNIILKKKTDRLLEGITGETDLFFIGFAGDASEDVFMNETKSAQAIMDQRLNTFGRSMVLINNQKTVENIPLANSHNLKTSLKQIAELMSIDEDILVLFLTSHGSEDHYLTANFPPFKLNNLNADTINAALNAAGIKWRIIIISACYSGGFIKPLTDPYTLLITASNATQNSFGCGHDGQYTYFGDAYLENGLKQTRSFMQAFKVAKEIILKREKKEGLENSDPQIMIGPEIEKKLNQYEKNIEEKSDNNWAVTVSQ
jgi:hypothetical protein